MSLSGFPKTHNVDVPRLILESLPQIVVLRQSFLRILSNINTNILFYSGKELSCVLSSLYTQKEILLLVES